MFANLRKAYISNREYQKAENNFYIENGHLNSWNEKEKTYSDNGLRRYSTAKRWEQYQSGEITRDKAVQLAQKRNNKKITKETAEKLNHLLAVAAAPDINFIRVSVEWKKSYAWGYCPTVEVITDKDSIIFTGHAGGYGYDKESAAIAEAFNKCKSILKILYTLKENGLKKGLSDYSKTACTRVSNENIIGYGAGHTTIPYFEGGVGTSCFISILEKAGFKCTSEHGKREDFYMFTR